MFYKLQGILQSAAKERNILFCSYFSTPQGLEDVSKYPDLLANLLENTSWTEEDIKKLAGLNILRVFKEAEERSFPNRSAFAFPLCFQQGGIPRAGGSLHYHFLLASSCQPESHPSQVLQQFTLLASSERPPQLALRVPVSRNRSILPAPPFLPPLFIPHSFSPSLSHS
uniref:Dipeptidase n=1 Tax=Timema genevievae TaxID=629358 RepID=A0A7R9PMN2_TIMGE|nr:unnamed protein product [Timema genevievae]